MPIEPQSLALDHVLSKNRLEFYGALLITVLVAWLHLTRMECAGGLWRDEAGACQVALLPSLHDITQFFPHEAFPLLFPLTVRAYAAVAGSSDTALRIFGLLVGLGTIAVLWINTRGINQSVPLISLALLGVNASFIQWTDSLRGYGLGTALILIAFVLHWRLIASPSRLMATLAAIAAICSVQTLYANAVLLLATGMAAAIIAVRRRHWRRAFLILGIDSLAAVSLLPYIQPLQGTKDWDVINTTSGFGASLFWSKLSAALASAVSGAQWLWVGLVVIAIVGVLSYSISSETRRANDAGLYCFVALLISIPAYFGFLKILGYRTQPWYYVALMGLVAVALEGVLIMLAERWPKYALRLPIAAAIVVWSFLPTWKAMHVRQTNLDMIAVRLKETAGGADTILVAPWYFGITFQRYYDGSAPWTTLPPISDHKMHRYDLLKAQMAASNPTDPVFNAMTSALKSGNKVWIVGGLSFPPPGASPRILAPAPHESFGWDEDAYAASWSMQTARFLQTHALTAEDVPIATDQVISRYEDAGLMVVQGWQDEGR